MKQKLLLLFIGVVIAFTSWSQLVAGNQLLGPSLSINSSNYTYNAYGNGKTFGVGLGVDWIKMKTNTVGYGVGLNYTFAKSNTTGLTPADYARYHYNNVSLSFFRRKYFPIHEQWSLFCDAGIAGGYNNTKYDQSGSYATTYMYTKSNVYNISAFAYPGIAYFIKKNFLVDISLTNFLTATFSHQKNDGANIIGNNYQTAPNIGNSFAFNSTVTASNILNAITLNFRWIIQ
jgi:hypothetical protein